MKQLKMIESTDVSGRIRRDVGPSKKVPLGLPEVCPCCGRSLQAAHYKVRRGKFGRMMERLVAWSIWFVVVALVFMLIGIVATGVKTTPWHYSRNAMGGWAWAVALFPVVIEGIALLCPRVRTGSCVCGWIQDFPFENPGFPRF